MSLAECLAYVGLAASRFAAAWLGGRIELVETSPAGTMFAVYVTCENVRKHTDVVPEDVATAQGAAT